MASVDAVEESETPRTRAASSLPAHPSQSCVSFSAVAQPMVVPVSLQMIGNLNGLSIGTHIAEWLSAGTS